MGKNDCEQIAKKERWMEDDFEALKAAYGSKFFNNWIVKDLKEYREQLKAKIIRIEEVLASKQDVSVQAKALFKS